MSSDNCVCRLDIQDQHAIKWLSGVRLKSTISLSVTSAGEVLILCDDPLQLNVYDHQANLSVSISLKDTMADPHHVVETHSNHFIIAHGGPNSRLHRVCEITREGSIVRSYGCLSGKMEGQLNRPVYVAVDAESSVYVCDYYNDRVLILDKEFILRQVLINWSENGLYWPKRLSLGLETGHLLVGNLVGKLENYIRHNLAY